MKTIILALIFTSCILSYNKTPTLPTTKAIEAKGTIQSGSTYYWEVKVNTHLDDSVKITLKYNGKTVELKKGVDYTLEPGVVYIWDKGAFNEAEYTITIWRGDDS